MKKSLPNTHWTHSFVMSAVDATKEWGILPSELGICAPKDNLAYMIALLDTQRTIEEIEIEMSKHD